MHRRVRPQGKLTSDQDSSAFGTAAPPYGCGADAEYSHAARSLPGRRSALTGIAILVRLVDYPILRSRSRRAGRHDDTLMEGFFSSLKGEHKEHQRLDSHAQGHTAIATYMETLYNLVRLRSSIGCRTQY